MRPDHDLGRCPLLGLGLLSLGTLAFEIVLPRLYAVSQFYHFAFLVVSLAMLGFGASGTWLALFPTWGQRDRPRLLQNLSLAHTFCVGGAYLALNLLPFDSFSVAWDPRQLLVLALHYILMALPFFCSGAVLNVLFMAGGGEIRKLYAVNLCGSAVGCLVSWMLPSWVGGEGTVWFSGLLGSLAALCFVPAQRLPLGRAPWLGIFRTLVVLLFVGLWPVAYPGLFALRLSPYKGLSYALQVPGARLLSTRWNAYSRVDVVQSPGIRSLPGLSYRYLDAIPAQRGIFLDGDDLSAVVDLPLASLDVPGDSRLHFLSALPASVAYRLRPDARALVLEPRGGLEIWTALASGATEVTAVEPNPLIRQASPIYNHTEVRVASESPRSFIRRTRASYDVIAQPLVVPYRSVRSGAYSLSEDYSLTVEAFRDGLSRLSADGIFVVTRWLQMPPSESLRTFALAVEAVEAMGGIPAQQIVAFRGYATMTILISARPFSTADLAVIRAFATERAFDLSYAPNIMAAETNRYNILPTSLYYELFSDLLAAEDRAEWYRAYAFDIVPPTDDHPFFGHFFKWAQAGQVLAELGKSWQPFGGAGYLIVVALLVITGVVAAGLIVAPVAALQRRDRGRGPQGYGGTVAYFSLLGLGYMLVEIPLMQRLILYLGQPAYAMTAVLAALLCFSGIGSALAGRMPLRRVLLLLVGVIGLSSVGMPLLLASTLSFPFAGRLFTALLVLAPLGFLMGMPFPQGIQWLAPASSHRLPWAYAVNGAASVVASVTAALLSLSLGFRWVLILGMACYACALWVVVRVADSSPAPEPLRP